MLNADFATGAGSLDIGMIQFPDFNFDSEAFLNFNLSMTGLSRAAVDSNGTTTVDIPAVQVTTDRLAVTFYSDRVIGSWRGNAVIEADGTGTDVPNNIVIGWEGISGPTPNYLQTFAVYAPQPDADLPTLST
jgi:hypothetical protein